MHFGDVVTFNCAHCDFVAHLTFQMRKVFVTRSFKSNYVLCRGAWTAEHKTKTCQNWEIGFCMEMECLSKTLSYKMVAKAQ